MPLTPSGLIQVGLVLALVGPGLIAMLSNAIATTPETLAPRALTLLLFVVITMGVVWIAHAQGPTLNTYGFAGAGWFSLPGGFLLAAFFIFVYGPAAYAALLALGVSGFDIGLNTLHALPQWYLILVVIVIASTEEWLYRAYAIETLERLTGRTWLAAGISLGAFTLVHLPLWGPGPALSIVISGAIFTALYIWHRDIILLIVGHVCTDLYGIVLSRT